MQILDRTYNTTKFSTITHLGRERIPGFDINHCSAHLYLPIPVEGVHYSYSENLPKFKNKITRKVLHIVCLKQFQA